MIFPRTVLIASAMLLAASVHAADVSMANGQVHFTTPNGWLDIMETEGDPEARVFQVPDPSPTAHSSLARVTVTVKQTADIPAFQQYVGEATAKAAALPGYTATAHGGARTALQVPILPGSLYHAASPFNDRSEPCPIPPSTPSAASGSWTSWTAAPR